MTNRQLKLLKYASITFFGVATLYSIAGMFMFFHIGIGTDLATGKVFRHYGLTSRKIWDNMFTDYFDPRPSIITLFVVTYGKEPEFEYYNLADSRSLPFMTNGSAVSFFGNSEGHWDDFHFGEYAPVMWKLRQKTMSASEAHELHRKMLDIGHSGMSFEERSAAIKRLADTVKSTENKH